MIDEVIYRRFVSRGDSREAILTVTVLLSAYRKFPSVIDRFIIIIVDFVILQCLTTLDVKIGTKN